MNGKHNKTGHRLLSGFMAMIMVFTMIAELAVGVPVSAAYWDSTITGVCKEIDKSSIKLETTIQSASKDKIKKAGFSYGEKNPDENKIILKKTSGIFRTKTYTVKETVDKLNPDTTYTGYFYLETKEGTVLKGNEVTFTTLKPITGTVSKTTETTMSVSAMLGCSTADHFNEIGFCYGIESPEENSVKLKSTEKYFNGNIKASKTISKLESNTNYVGYFYAKKKNGTVVQGTPITFSTKNPITGTIGHVYSDHVSINAVLKCEKADNFRKIGFCYGTAKPEENTIVLKEKKSVFTGNTKASVTIENLTANTTYVGYFYAEKKDGTKITSSLHTITTPETLVGQIKKTYDSSVSVSGTLYSSKADNINFIGFSYGKTDPEENKVVIKESKNRYTNKTSFSETIKGLEPNTTYIGYLYAKSADGKEWKLEPVSFTTSVTTVTASVSSVEHNKATLKLDIVYSGNQKLTSVNVHYGTDENCIMVANKTKLDKNTNVTLSELESDTTYYFYVSAVTKDGYTYKTEMKSFKTLSTAVEGITFTVFDAQVGEYKEIHTGDKAALTVNLFDEIRIKSQVVPSHALNKSIQIVSDNPNVVEVRGTTYLKAKYPGTATITAVTKDGGYVASCTIVVDENVKYPEKPVLTATTLDENRIQVHVDRKHIQIDGNISSILGDFVYENIKNGITQDKSRTLDTAGNAVLGDLSSSAQYAIEAQLEIQLDVDGDKSWDVKHYTDWSDIVTAKTTQASKKETEEETTQTETAAKETTPQETTQGTQAPSSPATSVTDQKPEVDGLLPSYTISKGGTLTLDFTVEDPLGGVVEKVTVKHNQTGSTCTASLSNNKPGVFTCHFDIDHAIFDTVGTYNFEVYARTTHFTVTDNRLDGSSFTVKVEDKPVTEQEPKVVGLDPAYTVEKGGTLILDFTVEDPLGGVVEKVTVKHNQTGSTCTASLSNNKPGVFTCHFDIDHSIFDKVGTYNFEVYARTTHFTITDNRLKNNSFTVTVTEPACKHLNKTPDTSNEGYTNIILTGATHTFNEKTEYVCDDCGTILTSSAKPIPKTEKHTLIQGKGYCECGHMDVSGNTPEPAYNNTSDTQTVYRTPETKKKDYGSIDGGESVTILGEWGERYLIEYTIDNNGGIKQGWVDKDVITKVKDEEKEEEIPVAKSSFYDINVVEEDSDGDTITFALTSLYPGDLTELIHIPFQGLDNVGYKGIEFGINNKTLGYFYIKEGESVSYCKVEKDAIIYSLGILGGGDGSGLGNSVIGNDGHIWWRESGSQTATKTFYWSVLGELYFKYNHFTKKLSWEKTYANNGEVVDSTFDIAFLVMGVYSFQKNVLGAAIKNVAKEIGKETIEYANKKVLKEIAKEYCKEFVKELGKELLSIPLEQIKEYLEDHYMYFFLPNYEDYTDKAKLFEDIQANKNYKQFLEDYATYGFPRGISLEMFSYEVALLIERAEKAGKTEFSLTKYGPTIELENGLYKKYYDSTITDE